MLYMRRLRVPWALLLFVTLAPGLTPRVSLPPVGAAPRAVGLPERFADQVVVDGLLAARTFVFTPDGRILIAERGNAASPDINFASIRVFKNGALLPQRAISLNVCGDGERGLLGLALDPGFSSNGYLYVYYTRQAYSGPSCAYGAGAAGPRNRVSRLTMSGDTIDPASERVLIDEIAAESGIHNGGDLHFGPDGNLYISVGDSASSPSPAGDLGSLSGKMLRIRPLAGPAGGYSIPDDNPFKGQAGKRGEIYAYGLRNPFRFAIDPATGTPFAFDVGGGTWEEINRIVSGGYYGYPLGEGPCTGHICAEPGYQDPFFAYLHNNPPSSNLDAAVIGGAFYTGASYPAEYQGDIFYGDYVQGWIRRLHYDEQAQSWGALDFATGAMEVIGIRQGLDGELYYLEIDVEANSKLHRIHYQDQGNLPPTALLDVDHSGGPLDTLYTFSAAGSSDPEGGALLYHWELGDGTTLSTSGITVTHTYTTSGVMTVTLTVSDDGMPPATSAPARVTVYPGNAPPTATIVLTNLSDPQRTDRYHAGDTWRYAVVDVQDDQALPPDPFAWSVALHHREHTHPFLSGIIGATGVITIPTSGEPEPYVWYRLSLQITDAQGQTALLTADLHPVTTTLTFATEPSGGQLLIEDKAYVTPATLTRVVGLQLALSAPETQSVGSLPYRFASWSHGQGRSHTLAVPASATSYTAQLRRIYQSWLPAVERSS